MNNRLTDTNTYREALSLKTVKIFITESNIPGE